MKKIVGLIVSLTLLAGILAGCAGTSAGSQTPPPESSPPAAQTETPEAGSPDASAAAWPRTVEDSLGKQITLEKKPERVALLDFGYIETMYALEIPPIASILAVQTIKGFGTLQPYAADVQVQELGTGAAPNLEKLAELQPDFILLTAEKEHLDMTVYEAVSKIAPVVAFNIPDWKAQLRAFAECLGAEEKAAAFISDTEALIAASRGKLAGYSDKTVALMFERLGKPGEFVITGSTENPVWFNAEDGLGLTPPDGYPKAREFISLEGLAEMNPDYLFLFGTVTPDGDGYKQLYLTEETKASSVWQSLNAVKNGHVYYLDAAVRAAGPLSIQLGIETIVESMTK
ncbi:iron complex transport system substrate-binding protein [Sporobacter termitidis DSM 10068]|uniref:Iron complex transport system substrate-binding protein n=1 Tax=Sporobacter termitidis DSM 10068 TaxID=1123282 RepID=A0A1M5YS38_9FIRM|nr:ABC transporter substrate-binding protein [Sporobacter termitidis]SHI14658.1 iron complex transport system substrate-binding protein [Sporobacter termitidis DSM 10068]